MSQELTIVQKRGLAIMAQEEKARSQSVIATIRDMKQSEFFRNNWDALLIAAPNCLELLGNVNAVASTKLASTTPLTAPTGGFTHLKDYGNLKGGLSQLSSQASKSFTVARIKMDLINVKSASVKTQMEIILAGLADPRAPMSSVMIQLQTLLTTAEECQAAATETQNSMILWSDVCLELHDACQSESAITVGKQVRAQSLLDLAKKQEEFRIKQETEAKAELKKMDDAVKDAKETYKGALNAMPTTDQLTNQAMKLGLMDAVGGILQVGSQALAASMNPLGAAMGAGAQSLKGEVDNYKTSTPKAGLNGTSTSKDTSTAKLGDNKPNAGAAAARRAAVLSKLTGTFTRRAKPKSQVSEDGSTIESSVPKDPAKTPENAKKEYGSYDLSGKFVATDKALAIAPAIKVAIDEIKNIVVGSPEGIKWESVQAPTDKSKGTSSELLQASYTLDRLLKEFKPTKDGLASQLAVAVMTEAIGVADDLEAEATKGSALGTWMKPTRKSEFFKDIDARITRCASTATALNSAVKSSPGNTGGGTGRLFVTQPTSEEKIANMNYKASIADQTVKSATTKLLSTQETYKATLDTYMKQSEQLMSVQESLLEARKQVASLSTENMTLESVKQTLIQCIGYLAELKDRISKLVTFFSGLRNLIVACIDSHVKPFKKEIENYAKENQDKALLYEQYYRDLIFKFTLRIMANFALFKDVSAMYLEVDRRCIQQGLLLVDKLNISNVNSAIKDEDYYRENKAKLSDFCAEAEKTVKQVVQAKQREIIDGLQKRIEDIGTSIAKFPVDYQPTSNTMALEYESVRDGAVLAQSLTEAEAANIHEQSTISDVAATAISMGDDDEEM